MHRGVRRARTRPPKNVTAQEQSEGRSIVRICTEVATPPPRKVRGARELEALERRLRALGATELVHRRARAGARELERPRQVETVRGKDGDNVLL